MSLLLLSRRRSAGGGGGGSAASYWMDSAYDSRLPVSALNSSGVDLNDHLVAVTVPVGVTIDSNSLRVVETTTLGSIDRAFDWRYATGTQDLNHLVYLPAVQSGGVVTFKALGRWPTAQARTFNLYWNAAGGIAAPNFNHLGAIAPGWTVALTAGTTGDSYTIVAGGATYTHVMTVGQTNAQIGTALAVLINAGAVATATGTTTLTIKAVDATSLTFTVANTGSTVPGNLVVTKPTNWLTQRTGPDTALFATASYPFGVPYGSTASGVFGSRVAFARNTNEAVRLMNYRVNGDGTSYGASDGTISSYAASGPYTTVTGDITFSTRSAAVDWTGTYTATHRQRIVVGRKSDDTGTNTLNKYVDVMRVSLTYTCARAYAPTTVASNQTTASNFDVFVFGNLNNTFSGNVTAAAGNMKTNFYAPKSTGTITTYTSGDSATLNTLPVVDTIIASCGNTAGEGVLVNSISLTNFGSQTVTPHWATQGNAFGVLNLVGQTSAVGATIPLGATITVDFWYVAAKTLSATTVGDYLLPDELVTVMQQLAYAPTVTISDKQTYAAGSLAATMALATSRAVDGVTYFQTNANTYTTVATNYAWSRNLATSTMLMVDDEDANYGEAHKLHGLCLRYKRTHDASLIALIEAQVQFHINIEAAAVAAYGSWWNGTAPYFYWPSSTSSGSTYTVEGGVQGGDIDPTFNGGVAGPITYTQGQVRRSTSIDQMHMVGHGLYAYLYILAGEAAITANTTLRTNALSLLSRMVTFEAAHFTAASRTIDNLYNLLTSASRTNDNGISDTQENISAGTALANPYYGILFGSWNVSNTASQTLTISSNSTIDSFFRAIWADNSTQTGINRFLKGRAMDMLASDYGYHDETRGALNATNGVIGTYPKGWMQRSQLSNNTVKYASPRTVATNNGYSTDLHYIEVNDSGGRDHFSGRGPQRIIVLALLALMDPSYDIPVEMNGASVLRSVNVKTALDSAVQQAANYLLEPTTKAQRQCVAGFFGKTSSYDPQIVDSAYTGYWMMASELWYLVQARVAGSINVADYYQFSGV